jgi:hypothetical protein
MGGPVAKRIFSMVCLAGLMAMTLGAAGPALAEGVPATGSEAGPFVTLLFSRTEMTGAVNCVPDDTGVARLDTTVAPYLAALGMTATGTLTTARISESDDVCVHYGGSMMASWSEATQLAQNFGWHFVSHTATYPSHMDQLTAQQSYDETCGSAHAIDAHGLPGGHGLIAYPGSQPLPTSLQTDYGANCFAWGRQYDPAGTTTSAAGSTSPYWQHTTAPEGGPCNDRTRACYRMAARDSTRYVLPAAAIARVRSLVPGEWFTLQEFLLVTGTSPAGSAITWDCRASDSRRHWTNDSERYCLRDWKKIVAAIAAMPTVQVTDPLTVGIAFGRPATYP